MGDRDSPPSLFPEAKPEEEAPPLHQPWRPSVVPDWSSTAQRSGSPQRLVRDLHSLNLAAPTPALVVPTTAAWKAGDRPAREEEKETSKPAVATVRPLPRASFFATTAPAPASGAEDEVLAELTVVPAPPLPPLPLSAEKDEPLEPEEERQFLERFVDLKRRSTEFHSRVKWSYDQLAHHAMTHQKEAHAFRDAVDAKLSQQKTLQDATDEELARARSQMEEAQRQAKEHAGRVGALEQENYAVRLQVTRQEQALRHAEDRARVGETGRTVAEIHKKELEIALDQISSYADLLRKKLFNANTDRDAALLRQHEAYEANRQELISFFDNRETALVGRLNETAVQVYRDSQKASSETAAASVEHWRRMYEQLKDEYARLQRTAQERSAELEREVLRRRAELEQDKERQHAALRAETEAAFEALRRREELLTRAAAARERELDAREAQVREERAALEESLAVTLQRKESELKATHETALAAAKASFEKERERLLDSFTDQLQRISNMHLNNESELERLHREKEREMGQRYRQTTTSLDEREGNTHLQDVASKTQDALLSRFASIEAKQRERAEQLRAAMKAGHSP